MMESLSRHESSSLRSLESTIAEGMRSFVEVGRALLEIRDRRLYKQEFERFEDYCDKRWGMRKSQAYRLIDGASVTENLSPMGDTTPQPTAERQVRPLASLTPAKQRQVWKKAVKESDGNVPTQATVERIAEPHKPPPTVKQMVDRAPDVRWHRLIADLFTRTASLRKAGMPAVTRTWTKDQRSGFCEQLERYGNYLIDLSKEVK